jgi:hypothetical protein
MININPSTYVQYVNKNGCVKVKQVEREVDGTNVFYNLDGINEEFFILGLYDLNKRVLGVTFSNIQNLDMIAFLNSDFQTVELLPEISFLPPLQFVAMVVDTLNYDINFDVVPKSFDFAALMLVLQSIKACICGVPSPVIPVSLSLSKLEQNVYQVDFFTGYFDGINLEMESSFDAVTWLPSGNVSCYSDPYISFNADPLLQYIRFVYRPALGDVFYSNSILFNL